MNNEDKRATILMFEIRLEAMRANDRTTEQPYLEESYLSLAEDFKEAMTDPKPQDKVVKCPKCETPMDATPFDYICPQASCGGQISRWRPG